MTTPSGQISLNDVNVELGFSGTTLIEMNQANVRTLAGVGGSGTPISMQDLQGKSNRVAISFTYASNTTNASLNVTSLSGYIAGISDITITVNAGVYVYSTNTGTYALALSGGASGDTVTIVNNGFIMGRGGSAPAYFPEGATGNAGGPAINLGFNTTITNTSGYIGGGGGAGGGVDRGNFTASAGGGGGAGGGDTTTTLDIASGASGGGPGLAGGNGGYYPGFGGTGGAGGRIMPGTGGASRTAEFGYNTGGGGFGGGSGGSGGASSAYQLGTKLGDLYAGGAGGGGGGYGASGGASIKTDFTNSPGVFPTVSGTGGSAGATGGSATAPSNGCNFACRGGGAGGKAVNLNGYSLTWTGGASSSSRAYGAVS